MKDEIRIHLNDARYLEKMYRGNKMTFKREFIALYPEVKGNMLADFWNERLNYESEEVSFGNRTELLFVIIASLIAGIIAKLPDILNISDEFFYPRNIGFIIFPMLAAYFAWKNKLSNSENLFIISTMVIGLVFINFLPDVKESDTLVLSCFHLPVFLWSLLGFAFVGEARSNHEKRLKFLKYNGDLVVITTLIVIAGGLLTAITIGLFSLIGINIEKFYFDNIVVFGLPAAPIIGTYLIQTNPQLVGKVSPVIARIFSPLVLVMLVIYLSAMVYSGKDPYNDREFLGIFNALLIGVMAILFFSVAETSTATKSRIEIWILFLLSLVTIVVSGIAISAIAFRIWEGGLTPNRAAVLGGDLLIFVNLLLVSVQLYKAISKKGDITGVGKVIAYFLTIYFIWAIIVAFLFPFLFGFS